jgi:hypothetical protein
MSLTLLTAVGSSDTTLSITPDSSLPLVDGLLLIGTEQITYATNFGGTLYGVTRGVNSTSAASHAVGVSLSLLANFQGSATGVSSIHADSGANLTGAVRFVSGSNVTLTQSGQAITVAASGGTSVYLQAVQGTSTVATTASNNTFIDTTLTASITLSDAAHRVKVTAVFWTQVHADDIGYHTIKRNSTNIGSATLGLCAGGAHTDGDQRSIVYIDTPATTSCTYTLQQRSGTGQSLQTGQTNLPAVMILEELTA